jgi:glycosyltransferase involved in cell wall biosynthesis
MPLALIEGMAAGCAVVGTAVPGVRETLRDGIDGRLVPENDARTLADVLEALLRDDVEAARLGAAAREAAVTRYSRERMSDAYEAMLLDAARGAAVDLTRAPASR